MGHEYIHTIIEGTSLGLLQALPPVGAAVAQQLSAGPRSGNEAMRGCSVDPIDASA